MEKLKHNHKLTDLLKVAMFSLVMLAPFLSIGVRCGYVMWNKNAKNSYSGTNTSDRDYEQVDSLQINTNYYWDSYSVPLQTNPNSIIYFDDFTDFYSSTTNVMTTITNNIDLVDHIVISNSGTTNSYMSFRDADNNTIINSNLYNNLIRFNFRTLNSTLIIDNSIYDYIFKITYNENYYMDNAFSYSVSQISNDPVFNWTRNTGIYQPINAMVQGLDIENDTLQILLAYWSLMTAVYIVFDLIIVIFTKITHFIND